MATSGIRTFVTTTSTGKRSRSEQRADIATISVSDAQPRGTGCDSFGPMSHVSDRIVASVHRNNKDIFISSLGCHHDEVELKRYGLGKYGNRKPDTGSETNVEVLGVSDSEIVSQPPGSAEATATTALQQEKKKNNDENAKVVRFAVTVVEMGEDHKCK